MKLEPATARKALLETAAELYQARILTPTGGNISLRAEPDVIWITPRGLFKGGLREEDLILVDGDGRVRQGRHPPSRETPLHMSIYAARPDVGAIIHSHPPLAITFGLFDLPVKPVTADAVLFRNLPVVEFLLPGTPALARRATEALGDEPAALLRNHGAVVVGADLRQAADRTHALEETCLTLLLARLIAAEPAVIPAALVGKLLSPGYPSIGG